MRKLLILLVLPIVAMMTMGSASLSVVAETTTAAQVQVLTPETSFAAPTALDECGMRGCAGMDPDARDQAYAGSLYLPINRWSDMAYHSRLNWWLPVEASNAGMSHLAAATMMNLGNSAWKTTADWSRGAMGFNPFETALGFQIDKVSGVIGTAITGQPVLFALIIVFLLVVVMWRAMRRPGTRPFGKLLQSAVVFGLITMMATQAAAGTSGTPPEKYTPQAGSPVWIANGVTGTVDNMASLAVASVMDGMLPVLTSATDTTPTTTNDWSCSNLIDSSFKVAKLSRPNAGAEAVSRAMNAMWISTAYSTYTNVQFGGSNPFAKEVACRQLERTTGADDYTRARMLSQSLYDNTGTVSIHSPGGSTPFQSLNSPLLADSTDNEADDAALVAWAACMPNDARGNSFTVRAGWGGTPNGSWITSDDCRAAFRATTGDELKGAADGDFNIADVDAARKKTDNESVLNFVTAIHGRDSFTTLGSTVSSVVFLAGALVAAGVFSLMSLAVFASKIFMLFMVAFMFIVLVVSLFKNESMGQTMTGPSQKFLGVTIFAFGSTLLLALLATIALVIAAMATMFGAPGSIGAMLWVSASPVLAVAAVHFMFTKMFKMPSPVTAKGALAWGTAGGAVGGAVGAGLVNRMGSRGRQEMKKAGKNLLGKSQYTSWMVGGNSAGDRRGAGDAGSRKKVGGLAGDLTSNAIRDRDVEAGAHLPSAPGVGGAAAGAGAAAAGAAVGAVAFDGKRPFTPVTPEYAEAAAAAASESMKNLSKDTKAEIQRDAARQWRQENPRGLRAGIADLKGKIDARQNSRAALLAESANAGSAGLSEEALLSPAALGKVSLVNRPSAEEFSLLAPGEQAPMVSAIPPAAWKDLSPQGKAEAQKLAAAKARANRAEAKTAAVAEKGELKRQAQLRRDARAAAKAELPPLSDRAKDTVRRTAVNAGNTAKAAKDSAAQVGSAAWREAKTKTLEFRANPAETTAAAASAAIAGTRRAARATADAARVAPYAAADMAGKATAAVAEKTAKSRATAAAATGYMRSANKGAVASGVAAGAALAGLGNPVVGGVMVASAAVKGGRAVFDRRKERSVAKKAQINDIAAARANARKMPTPGTSTVSAAAPVTPRKEK